MPVDWYIMFSSVSQNYIVAKGRVHWRNELLSVDPNSNYRLTYRPVTALILCTYAIHVFLFAAPEESTVVFLCSS